MADSFAVHRSKWVPDDEVSSCMRCKGPFLRALFKSGKHHCRRCGKVVCRKCRCFEIKRQGKTYPVCSVCFDEYHRDHQTEEEQSKSGSDQIDGVNKTNALPCLSSMNSLDSLPDEPVEEDSQSQTQNRDDSLSVQSNDNAVAVIQTSAAMDEDETAHGDPCVEEEPQLLQEPIATANEMAHEGVETDSKRQQSDVIDPLLLQSDEQMETVTSKDQDDVTGIDSEKETDTSESVHVAYCPVEEQSQPTEVVDTVEHEGETDDDAAMIKNTPATLSNLSSMWLSLLLGVMLMLIAMYFGATLRTNIKYCDSLNVNSTNRTGNAFDEECRACPQNAVCVNGTFKSDSASQQYGFYLLDNHPYYTSFICTMCALAAVYMFVTRSPVHKIHQAQPYPNIPQKKEQCAT